METTYRLSLHRFAITELTANGLDTGWLLREAGLPGWTLDDGDIQVPVLHAILEKVAAKVPPPPALAGAWVDQVAEVLAEAIAAGDASLATVARRLMVSRRTLQRRLTEAGTTWRQELDRARLERLRRAGTAGGQLGRARQAEILGYSGPQAIRRAARRWESIAERRVPDGGLLALRS